MGNFMKQQEARKEVKEKDKVRREKLAGILATILLAWIANKILK